MMPILPPADDQPPKKKHTNLDEAIQPGADPSPSADESNEETEEDEVEEQLEEEFDEQLEEEWREDWEGAVAQEGDEESESEEVEQSTFSSTSADIISRAFGFQPSEQLETEERGNPDDLITIATYRFIHEAELAKIHLLEAGVHACIMQPGTGMMDLLVGKATGNIELQVPRLQMKDALDVLVRSPKPSVKDNEDDETENITCLSCGAAMTADQSHCPVCGWSYHEERIQE